MRLNLRIRKATFPLHRLVSRWVRPGVRAGGPPTGVFSEEDSLRSGLVEGGLLPPLKPFPEIPVGSEVREAKLGQDQYQHWKPLWTKRDNVFLAAPSFAHISDSGKVCREAIFGIQGWSDPAWQRKSPRPLRRLAGNYTSIVSRWNEGNNYFHWFLDGLTRLASLSEFPEDCRILVPADLPRFALRSLELLGLHERVVEVGLEDLEIEHYWFAGPTMLSGCLDPTGVTWLRRQFLQGAEPRQHRRIYLERHASTRRLTNASDVREVFEGAGWDIVDPGELALDEQIGLFREARLVAGVHGAAMTNLLWAQKGTRVLEFMPARRRNGCYAGISLVAGLPHQTLVSPSNRAGGMRASIEEVRSKLHRMEDQA